MNVGTLLLVLQVFLFHLQLILIDLEKQSALLYSYIEKYWKKDLWDLENTEFDLEECFTLIQLQLKEAAENNEEQKYYELINIQYLLKYFLNEVLSEFVKTLKVILSHQIPDKLVILSTAKILKN